MSIQEEIEKLALWKYNGSDLHVQTSESGLHTDLYLNTDRIVSNVDLVEDIVKIVFTPELQKRKVKPDWIITYPPFGLAIAYELAKKVGAKFGYVDIKKQSV